MRGGARVLPGGPTTRRGWASAAYRLAPLIAMGSALASPQFAAHACAPCHAKQVEGYFKSGMGRSLSRAFDQPGGSFRHTASGTRFEIAVGGGTMRQRIERRGMEAEYPIDYTIGSGNAGYGFLVKAGDRLFQSPVSYYTKSRKWEIAPGYEAASHPDFNRPVAAECVWCHAGRPLHIAESVNRYREPVFEFEAISCDRCHGPVENHLKRPLAATIVNPRKLPQTLRQGVCEQCHLGGEARVLNLGRSWGVPAGNAHRRGLLRLCVFPAAGGSGPRRLQGGEPRRATGAKPVRAAQRGPDVVRNLPQSTRQPN